MSCKPDEVEQEGVCKSLPIEIIAGQEYFRDDRLDQYREVNNPHNFFKISDFCYAAHVLENNPISKEEAEYYKGKTGRKPHGMHDTLWDKAYKTYGMTIIKESGPYGLKDIKTTVIQRPLCKSERDEQFMEGARAAEARAESRMFERED